MDYMTKPISRSDLRVIAKAFRARFGCKNKLRFNVINAYERFPSLFPNVVTQIIDDDDDSCMPSNIPSSCTLSSDGTVGGYRAHILHEMCHAILIMMGFSPIMGRAFKNNQIEPYRSMEWQAKALAGEILVPYERTKGMSVKQIMAYCGVSKACAKMRLKLDVENAQ